jgi:hypothetical protein
VRWTRGRGRTMLVIAAPVIKRWYRDAALGSVLNTTTSLTVALPGAVLKIWIVLYDRVADLSCDLKLEFNARFDTFSEHASKSPTGSCSLRRRGLDFAASSKRVLECLNTVWCSAAIDIRADESFKRSSSSHDDPHVHGYVPVAVSLVVTRVALRNEVDPAVWCVAASQ